MRTRLRAGIGFEITVLVLCGASLALAVTLYYGYTYSKEIILKEAEKNAQNLTESVARKIEQEFRVVQGLPQTMAAFLESGPCDGVRLENLLRRLVTDNKEVYGAAAAFEPFVFARQEYWYAPYAYREAGHVLVKRLGSPNYDYFVLDWYHVPKTLKKAAWLDPYLDEGGGGTLMTTYAVPFFDRTSDGSKSDEIRGVLTADLSLNWLTDLVQSIQICRTGYCFIVSDRGTFMTFPDRSRIMSESIFSVAEEMGAPWLRKVGLDMIRKQSGFRDIGTALSSADAYLAHARIPSTGWAVGGVFPKDELLAEVNALHRKTVVLAVAGVALLLCMSLLVARSISRPLRRMADVTGRVAHGDLDVQLAEVTRTDEVGDLARAFEGMAAELKKYIKDLTDAVSARQRIESELSIAADIQRQMLPSVFPAFPGRNDFDIHALMRPAKEVGGDFYDFFLIDDDHLCVVVGDVSGKGVPASLFMSVTKYLIEAVADIGEPPEAICARVNRRLVLNNESCMFVTVFLGVLNLKTGELLSANCGHTPPILGGPGMAVKFMGPPGGPVLGVLDDATFGMERTALSPGAFLLVFTDGVTEAFNTAGELYTEQRLLSEMTGIDGGSAKVITEAVLAAVDSFAKDAPQADDITILTLRFTPKPGPA